MGAEADFRGEVADYYVRYRRGYPPAVADAIVGAFRLGDGDTVLDLGCGSGQLTGVLAGRVGAVIGMDPEPDMLARAPRAGNVSYRVGSDRDVPGLEVELGALTVAVVEATTVEYDARLTVDELAGGAFGDLPE